MACVTLCWGGLAYGIVSLVAAAIFAGYATISVHRIWMAGVIRFGLQGVLATAVGLWALAYTRRQRWSNNLFKL